MGCSTCGGGRSAARTPGGTAKHPIVLGEPDGRPSQVATFLVDHAAGKVGQYRYVAGDGVEPALEDGTIVLGYIPGVGKRALKPAEKPAPVPQWYVLIGKNRWIGFKTKSAADRYALIRGGEVATRDDVLGGT